MATLKTASLADMAAIEAMKMVSRNVILRIFIRIMVLMGGIGLWF